MAGTLTGPGNLVDAITSITLTDKNGDPVWQGLNGNDLRLIKYWKGRLGKYFSLTAIANAAATQTFEIPCTVDSSKLPLQCAVTYNTLAAMGTSGQTSASITLTLVPVYRDGITTSTERVFKVPKTTTVGSMSFNRDLIRGKKIIAIGATFTAAKFSQLSFSWDSSPEFVSLDLNSIAEHMGERFVDGNQSGVMLLEPLPFVPNDLTVLDWVTLTSADTVNLYLFSEDA